MNEQYDSISCISQVNVKNIYNSLSFDQFRANPNAPLVQELFARAPQPESFASFALIWLIASNNFEI